MPRFTFRTDRDQARELRAFARDEAVTESEAIRLLLQRGLEGGELKDPERAGYRNGYAAGIHAAKKKLIGLGEAAEELEEGGDDGAEE